MKQNGKVSIDIQIDMLNSIISYLFTQDNPHINRKTLTNIRKFFDYMDTRMYETDETMMARIFFIKRTLECKLDQGIYNFGMIIENIMGGIHDEEVQLIVEELNSTLQMTSEEAKGVNNYISERLKFIHLFMFKDQIMNEFEKLEIGDYETISEINTKVKTSISDLLSEMRRSESEDLGVNELDLTVETFENVVTTIVNDLCRPHNHLKTGLQYLNEMFNGGYEAGRVYMFIGPSGGFKSGILLSSLRWIREYNQEVETRDPNKRPCVVYITQENSMKETVERLFNLYVSGDDIRNYSPNEVIALLRNKGGLDLDVNGVQLKLIYKPNKSISTDDLYSIMDEIEEEGLEVIALIHDYIKRIRAAQPTKDLRLDLGNIVDELTVIAKLKNIPVITATQLNRDAIKTIESAIDSGQSDIAKKLGSSQVGESWAVIENVDYATIIFKEYKPSTDTYYLTFKNVKSRAKNPTISYFAHPFAEGNQMQLIDDINLKDPVSVKNISEELASTDSLGQRGRMQGRNRLIATNMQMRSATDSNEVEDMEGL